MKSLRRAALSLSILLVVACMPKEIPPPLPRINQILGKLRQGGRLP